MEAKEEEVKPDTALPQIFSVQHVKRIDDASATQSNHESEPQMVTTTLTKAGCSSAGSQGEGGGSDSAGRAAEAGASKTLDE